MPRVLLRCVELAGKKCIDLLSPQRAEVRLRDAPGGKVRTATFRKKDTHWQRQDEIGYEVQRHGSAFERDFKRHEIR